jgi:hypothetical protein
MEIFLRNFRPTTQAAEAQSPGGVVTPPELAIRPSGRFDFRSYEALVSKYVFQK